MMKKIVGCILIMQGLYVAYGIYSFLQYKAAFEKTKLEDSLLQVITRFGKPDLIEGRILEATGYDNGSRSVCGGKCWLRLGYVLPFSLGTTTLAVDFDMEQKVIHMAELGSD